MPKFMTWLLVCALLLPARTVRAEDIVVSNYGSGSPPFPWSVAVEKKYFQEEGVDITGIISSEGGGTTVRNMVAGGVIFGEMNPAAFIAAVQQGAKLRLVADTVPLIAGMVWAVKADCDGHQELLITPRRQAEPGASSPPAFRVRQVSTRAVRVANCLGYGQHSCALGVALAH
jgi:hypothetical protein